MTPPDRCAPGRATLRAAVTPGVLAALRREAEERRLSPSRLLDELLVRELPALAEERVRRLVAPAAGLRLVPEPADPPALPPGATP